MRFFVRLTLVLVLLPSIAEAKDMYLPITGSVGVFRTDARVFNPSGTKDITVTATFIPAAGNAAPPSTRTLTIPKRQMLIRNDVVQSVFASSGLGAIKLSSPDDFQATARIYAETALGTLGQFSPAVDSTAAKTKGVVIQLKSNGTTGQIGTFRTNLGFLNVGAAQANVTLRLYDKNNGLITPPTTITVSAGGVLPPGNYFNVAGDFTDAWVSYESSQPLIAYGSVVDNGTTDPTFIPAFEDTGSNPQEPPPPSTKTFNISAEDGSFSSDKALVVQVGDRVILRITALDTTHGFALENYAPGGVILPRGVTQPIEFVADRSGRFFYFCTVTGCSPGHTSMVGTFVVEGEGDGGGPGY